VRAPSGRRLGTMELGLAIGQDSLLTREPSRITVEAMSDVLVLRMPVERFSKLLMKRPDIVQRFQIAHRR
jgi:CRP-like cAMP-binding protein